MAPWSSSTSSSYQSYGRLQAENMEMVTVRNGNGNPSSIFVDRSRARPLDLPAFSELRVQKTKKGWRPGRWWNEPDMKRRRRVAKYKLYSSEGKLKASVKHGLRWIKHKCSKIGRRF